MNNDYIYLPRRLVFIIAYINHCFSLCCGVPWMLCFVVLNGFPLSVIICALPPGLLLVFFAAFLEVAA